MDTLLAIYPTARKVREVLKTDTSSPCHLAHRTMTFPQLVDALWREFGREAAALDAVGELLAVSEALSRVHPERRTAMRPRPALGVHLLGLVRQLRSAAVAADDLAAAETALGSAAARRTGTLAALLAAYEALLHERRLVDRHGRERSVLEGLWRSEAQNRRPEFLGGVNRLLVAEIYDLGLLQFMIIASLIRIVGDAEVTIQAEAHRVDTARFAELTLNRFVAEESIADLVLPGFLRREGRHGRLGFLLKHVFIDDAPTPPPVDESVEIVEAPTRLAEVEEVGRAIRRALEAPAGGRVAPDRIAVVARDLGPYASHLETVFRRYGIPLHLRHGGPLGSFPEARLVLDLLSLAAAGFPRRELLKIARSPHVSVRGLDDLGLLDEAGYIDAPTRPLIECLGALRARSLRELAESPGERARKRLGDRLKRLERLTRSLEPLLDALKPLSQSATIREHLDHLISALAALGFDPGAKPPTPGAGRERGALLKALGELYRAAGLVSPDRLLEPAEFAQLLEAAFGLAETESGAEVGGVRALPVLEARGLDFDLVFILGLNDGLFPLHRGDDPLLPDSLAAALNQPLAAALRRRLRERAPSFVGKLLRTRAEREAEEAMLFFLALSMPEQRLVLCYSREDETGAPLAASPFLEEVVRVLVGASGKGAPIRRIGAEEFIAKPEDCFSQGEFLNAAALCIGGGDGALRALLSADTAEWVKGRIATERHRESYLALPTREQLEPRQGLKRREPDPRKLNAAGPFDGHVAPDERLSRFLVEKPWNHGAVSDLAACGFKFFASRILGLKEAPEVDHEQSARDRGGSIHRLLRALMESGIDFRNRDTALAQAHRFLDDARARYREDAPDPVFFDLWWQRVARTVEELIELEVVERVRTGTPELENETSFTLALADRDGTLGQGGGASLTLNGRIDRLELYRDAGGRIARLRVLDYKDSRRADDYAKRADPNRREFGHTDFQLALYLMAALDRYAGELLPDAALEAGYVVLRALEKFQTHPVPRAMFEPDPKARADEPPIAERILALVAEATAGRFDVDPLECDEYCPYRAVCRYVKFRPS